MYLKWPRESIQLMILVVAQYLRQHSPYRTCEWIIEAVRNIQVGKHSPCQRILYRRHVVVDGNFKWRLELLLGLLRSDIIRRDDQCVNCHIDWNNIRVDVLVAVPKDI